MSDHLRNWGESGHSNAIYEEQLFRSFRADGSHRRRIVPKNFPGSELALETPGARDGNQSEQSGGRGFPHTARQGRRGARGSLEDAESEPGKREDRESESLPEDRKQQKTGYQWPQNAAGNVDGVPPASPIRIAERHPVQNFGRHKTDEK